MHGSAHCLHDLWWEIVEANHGEFSKSGWWLVVVVVEEDGSK